MLNFYSLAALSPFSVAATSHLSRRFTLCELRFEGSARKNTSSYTTSGFPHGIPHVLIHNGQSDVHKLLVQFLPASDVGAFL